jgi:hypothetical protein
MSVVPVKHSSGVIYARDLISGSGTPTDVITDLNNLRLGVEGWGVDTGLTVTWVSGMSVKIATGWARLAGARWSLPDTTVDSSMNGLSLPRTSLTVNASEGFAAAPSVLIVVTSSGAQVIPYSAVADSVTFTTSSVGAGTLSTGNNVSQGLTLTAADSSHARIDLIVIDSTGTPSVVTGTPAVSPVKPTIPANSVPLASIVVAAGAAAISAGVITDERMILPTLNTNFNYKLDNSSALKNWRTALNKCNYKAANILFGPGDSQAEGYRASTDFQRYMSLVRQRLQENFNPSDVPGGEGFIPFIHSPNGFAADSPPVGSATLPQRWTFPAAVGLPYTNPIIGLSQRGGYLDSAGEYGILLFWGDRCWLTYTQSTSGKYLGWAVDATVIPVATLGVLTGTGTGTFTIGTTYTTQLTSPRFPTASHTITIDDEDMTVTMSRDNITFTISARGVNGTTAVAHSGTPNVIWAANGLVRVNTNNATHKAGVILDSGQLTRGTHSLFVAPINRASGGYYCEIDGAMVFDGDGGVSQATFTDGSGNQTNPTFFDSATANFTSADLLQRINGTNIPPNTVITSITSATRVVLSQSHTIPGTSGSPTTGITFSIGGRGYGVHVWDCSRAGASTSDWKGPAGTTQGYWAEALDVVDPDLCIIELGSNDLAVASNSEKAYYDNLCSIIDLIRAKAPRSPSIIIQTIFYSAFWLPGQWQAILNGAYSAALAKSCAVLDLTPRLPDAPASGSNEHYADTFHPTDVEEVQVAQEICLFLETPGHPFNTIVRTWAYGGDGSDGNLLFDGASTVLGMVPSSSTYTLTRDIFARNMVVAANAFITTNNFRIFGTGTLTNYGVILNSGLPGASAVTSTPGTGGAVIAVQTLSATIQGGTGGAVAGAGNAGGTATAANGPILGGRGGDGATAGAAGGAGGNVTNTANLNSARTLLSTTTGMGMPSAASPNRQMTIQGGQGGGGGGGQAATNAGGGGGAGAGVIVLCFQTILNLGVIAAIGGTGGTAPVGSTAGGGGGGGGGVVFMTTMNLMSAGSIFVQGGRAGVGGAGQGIAGSPGTVILLQV